MKTYLSFLLGILLMGCSSSDSGAVENEENRTLAQFIKDRQIAQSSVIACAGSTSDASRVRVYLYPRPGVTNIRYFETLNTTIDANNFENYFELQPPIQGLFNGFLQFFEVVPANEKWVIITFEEAGIVNISNPIRLKQLTQITEYLPENISISNEIGELMPKFDWVDGTFDDSAIYFQVVSTEEGDFLSGTYTIERSFQYYVLDNVVLNIREEEPPTLDLNTNYYFTLLSVTEDNWVNRFSEIQFRLN